MKHVYLHGKLGIGRYVIVDDDDYARVYKAKPYMGTKYVYVKGVDGKPEPLQNFILGYTSSQLKEMGKVIDHKDRWKMNVRKYNLRVVNVSENNQNKTYRNVTGYRGVSKVVHTNGRIKWSTRIHANGYHRYIGVFETPELAARAYDKAALLYYGEGCFLNFPDEV